MSSSAASGSSARPFATWQSERASARIVAIEPSAARAPIARAVGADVVLTPDEWAAQRAEILPGGADVVVDAVGSVLPQAIEAAAMGARVVVFGMNGNARPAVHQVE